jgi:hypothetical protein
MGMNSSKYDKVELGQLVPLTADQMITGKAPATSTLKLKITKAQDLVGKSWNRQAGDATITNASGEQLFHFSTLGNNEGIVEDADCNRLAVSKMDEDDLDFNTIYFFSLRPSFEGQTSGCTASDADLIPLYHFATVQRSNAWDANSDIATYSRVTKDGEQPGLTVTRSEIGCSGSRCEYFIQTTGTGDIVGKMKSSGQDSCSAEIAAGQDAITIVGFVFCLVNQCSSGFSSGLTKEEHERIHWE